MAKQQQAVWYKFLVVWWMWNSPRGISPNFSKRFEVERPGKEPLILEVQKHIGDNWVRTVAMDATDGLQRGVPAVQQARRSWSLLDHPHWGAFSMCSAPGR